MALTVKLTVSESVTYEFTAEVEAPADVVNDPDSLHEFLSE
ncbi:hypothetical protein ACFC7A_26900 [Streptomyces niveus]